MPLIRARIVITGRVQGVCFRMYTEEEAKRRGLTGWVRNLPTGQVEAVIEGEREAVEDLIRWCHQGPPAASVKKVDTEWEPYRGDFTDFRTVH